MPFIITPALFGMYRNVGLE